MIRIAPFSFLPLFYFRISYENGFDRKIGNDTANANEQVAIAPSSEELSTELALTLCELSKLRNSSLLNSVPSGF